ncbi:XF1762 family protein [Kitasatospora sp. cg17-2]
MEVTRVATDGTSNACSKLYAAAWRATSALGYTRLVTYTRADETGASLRAAGWRVIAQHTPHSGWDRPSRPRRTLGSEHIPRTL